MQLCYLLNTRANLYSCTLFGIINFSIAVVKVLHTTCGCYNSKSSCHYLHLMSLMDVEFILHMAAWLVICLVTFCHIGNLVILTPNVSLLCTSGNVPSIYIVYVVNNNNDSNMQVFSNCYLSNEPWLTTTNSNIVCMLKAGCMMGKQICKNLRV